MRPQRIIDDMVRRNRRDSLRHEPMATAAMLCIAIAIAILVIGIAIHVW